MSLPLPAEFEHRGRSHYLLHCHGVGLPGWHDLGVATPGWNGGRMTFSLLKTRLIVSRVSRSCRNGETLPPLGGVAGGPRQTLTRTDWVYDVNVPVPFEGWMLIGEQDALDAAAAFGVDAVGLPFTIFTDTSGRVIALHMGELTADEANLILGAVSDVNAGRTDPAQARQAIAAALAALPPATEQKSGG